MPTLSSARSRRLITCSYQHTSITRCMAVELTRPGAFGYALPYWSTSCPANADVGIGLVTQICALAKPVRWTAHSNAHRRGNIMSNDQVVREQLLAMLRGGQAFMPFDQ